MTKAQVLIDTPTVGLRGSVLVESGVSCARWIRAAAGASKASVRVAVLDRVGRLRVIAREGGDTGWGRLRSNRRRTVVLKQQRLLLSNAEKGLSLGLFPLVDGEATLGVVEVIGPTSIIEERMEALEALISQSALVVKGARAQIDAERALEGKSALVCLAADLMEATTAVEVLRHAVRACHGHLGVPVAGLLPDRDGWGWFVAASEGMGTRRRDAFRSLAARSDPLEDTLLQDHFKQAVGSRQVTARRAGDTVLLVGDTPSGQEEFLTELCSLIAESLPGRQSRGGPSRRPSNDIGIAWTAHELRGPILGARAALDLVSEQPMRSDGLALLLKTRLELEQLSELIEPLLRWASGNQALDRRVVDLVEVAREAIATACLGDKGERVDVIGPDQLLVLGDRKQLRSAIGNVVRNAIAHSPGDTQVIVEIQDNRRWARVLVRDQGIGLPPQGESEVFELFNRGASGDASRGTGLGLFIARRILEAHGGSIAVRRPKKGATFVLEIPAEGWERFAS